MYFKIWQKILFAVQAEGSQVSANLEYLYRQSLILGMENQALRQRLDSLSQEQLAKYRKSPDVTPLHFYHFCNPPPPP